MANIAIKLCLKYNGNVSSGVLLEVFMKSVKTRYIVMRNILKKFDQGKLVRFQPVK